MTIVTITLLSMMENQKYQWLSLALLVSGFPLSWKVENKCFSRTKNFNSRLKWIQSSTSALKIRETPCIGIKSPLNNYLIQSKDQFELNWYLYSGCFISQSLCLLTSSFQKHLYNNQSLQIVTSSRFKVDSVSENISRTCVHQWSHLFHRILQAELLLLRFRNIFRLKCMNT